MIEDWNVAARLLAVGATIMLLILLLLGEVRRPIKTALVGLLFGASSYLINSAPEFDLPQVVRPWIDLASLFTPFWTWLFARHLFEREPAAKTVWPVIALMTIAWFSGQFLPQTRPFGFYIVHIVSLLLLADLLFTAWSGRDDDLIEKRRLIRLWLPLLVAAQAGGILIVELVIGNRAPPTEVQLLNALLILALTLFSGTVLLRTDPELLVETEQLRPARTSAEISPADKVLRDKLDASMNEGFYRTAGLTIAALAEHLGTQEHRLRAVINRNLGHRNFAAFLNRHRIEEAKSKLADSDLVETPVLTIAMDLGYNSLATFNRAFRAETGTTPTEFRREAISQN